MRIRHDEALETYNALIKVTENTNNTLLRVKAMNGICNVSESQGNYRLMLDYSKKADELARGKSIENREFDVELSAALYYHGKALLRLGQSLESQKFAQESLAIARKIDAKKEMANALNLLGASHGYLGQFEHASKYFEDTLFIARQLGNRNLEAAILNNLGDIKCNNGDFEKATMLFKQALDLCLATGMKDVRLMIMYNLGRALQETGDYVNAISAEKEVLFLSKDKKWQLKPAVMAVLTIALARTGEVKEAIETIKKSIEAAEESGNTENIGNAWRAAGCLASVLGNESLDIELDGNLVSKERITSSAALSTDNCFKIAIDVFQKAGYETETAATLVRYAEYKDQKGDAEAKGKLLSEALGIFESVGAASWVERLETKVQHGGR